LSPSELMAQTLVTSGTMTTRVEKLAARRLVQRSRRETGDRRGVRVQLTDAGREVVDAAFEALLAHERTLLSSLSVADQAELANLLRGLKPGQNYMSLYKPGVASHSSVGDGSPEAHSDSRPREHTR
jgi:DNA-binding MarR family transcriptional regulator